jgi:hypothetical protein
MEMLTQAKRMLDEGHLTEDDIELAFTNYLQVWSRLIAHILGGKAGSLWMSFCCCHPEK